MKVQSLICLTFATRAIASHCEVQLNPERTLHYQLNNAAKRL
jgi:hypothetical protein